ncbi:hypothetical protein MLD38_007937 [Melastoma candidum]|uniref:Uncharacterized protein n=1 Tax=Melastoma candidum TaxID=119954 RepID=A0ACB9RWF7_9MYRT|nr:hypothetical protein MLD38_007937 [Melastoma candidum]
MAWFGGRVSLGNFPDLAGAVNKISESVKNIEKNFDSALGFEENSESSNEASGIWPSATDTKAIFQPVMAFMGQKSDEDSDESSKQPTSPEHQSKPEEKGEAAHHDSLQNDQSDPVTSQEENREPNSEVDDGEDSAERTNEPEVEVKEFKSESLSASVKLGSNTHEIDNLPVAEDVEQEVYQEAVPDEVSSTAEAEPVNEKADVKELAAQEESNGLENVIHSHEDVVITEESEEKDVHPQPEIDNSTAEIGPEPSGSPHSVEKAGGDTEISKDDTSQELASEGNPETASQEKDNILEESTAIVETIERVDKLNDGASEVHDKSPISVNSEVSVAAAPELDKLKKEMKMMETALKGAARQAQAKADEIAKLMNENEQLKVVINDLKRKSNDTEIESLREEYHQRVATLERKVYALTKERDTLRREQNKKSDAAALLKEKDEIISQVMAEGEELSKKQAAQESTIRKLRAQVRELEEEKKGLTTKLQVEENKVESIKKDKAATEKLLQETVEKHQAELSAQKEFYIGALNAAKEAEALAETRANSEARTELENRLREVEEREAMLVQTLEELRQTLSRKEQQSVFREDMLRRDIEELQKRYQESERRCEELISQVPESTRPLLRQIEAIQEAASRKAEAWAAVERSLNSRLQEAEAKAASAEERERSINDRLSQTLSRVNVLEAQISCLRAEQTQLSRSLEKERHRAAENRQEYLAAKEEADTQEGRAKQLEEEIKEMKLKHKQDLQEALVHRELLQQEVEREKAARLELEKASRANSVALSDPITKPSFDNGNLTRKLSSTSSLGSMEESYFLQASLDSDSMSERRNHREISMSERRNHGEIPYSPYYMKSMTPSAFESTLRQKEGELASYMSRLASMEAIRDSLAEELVKMTAQCEKLRVEAAAVPGIRAELEALRRRHTAALELMGERDEELEELRNDIVDLKEMYREQVNLLVNQIQTIGS